MKNILLTLLLLSPLAFAEDVYQCINEEVLSLYEPRYGGAKRQGGLKPSIIRINYWKTKISWDEETFKITHKDLNHFYFQQKYENGGIRKLRFNKALKVLDSPGWSFDWKMNCKKLDT